MKQCYNTLGDVFCAFNEMLQIDPGISQQPIGLCSRVGSGDMVLLDLDSDRITINCEFVNGLNAGIYLIRNAEDYEGFDVLAIEVMMANDPTDLAKTSTVFSYTPESFEAALKGFQNVVNAMKQKMDEVRQGIHFTINGTDELMSFLTCEKTIREYGVRRSTILRYR